MSEKALFEIDGTLELLQIPTHTRWRELCIHRRPKTGVTCEADFFDPLD